MNAELVVSGLEKHAVIVRTYKQGGTPTWETLSCACGGFAESHKPEGKDWLAERIVFRARHSDR